MIVKTNQIYLQETVKHAINHLFFLNMKFKDSWFLLLNCTANMYNLLAYKMCYDVFVVNMADISPQDNFETILKVNVCHYSIYLLSVVCYLSVKHKWIQLDICCIRKIPKVYETFHCCSAFTALIFASLICFCWINLNL